MQFLTLRKLIVTGEIDIVICLDIDRLEGLGEQRVIFLKECREYGVEVLSVHGQIPDVTTLSGKREVFNQGIEKEAGVLRARTGAKEGLAERVNEMGLPTSYHLVDGYKWVKVNLKAKPPILHPRLIKDELRYPVVELIANGLKAGKTAVKIIKELVAKGYKPRNGGEWYEKAIYRVARRPVYEGKYYGLQTVNIHESPRERQLKHRKGKVRGIPIPKPLEQQTYMPDIIVESPLFTHEERQRIITRLDLHSRNSTRNGRQDYIYKGFIFSNERKDKHGQPQVYHGRFAHGRKQYRCPLPTTINRIIYEDDLDPYVKSRVLQMVTHLKKAAGDKNPKKASVNLDEVLSKELEKIAERKSVINNRLMKAWEEKTDAEMKGKSGDIKFYDQIKGKETHDLDELEAKAEKIKEQRTLLANQESANAEMITFFERFGVTGTKSKPTDDEWHELFTAVDLKLRVRTKFERRDKLFDIRNNMEMDDPTTFCGVLDVDVEVGVPVSDLDAIESFFNVHGNPIPRKNWEILQEMVPVTVPALTAEMIEKLDSVSVGSIDGLTPRNG
jgi:DNA invertase Pin-like site-specific DNA recombinase